MYIVHANSSQNNTLQNDRQTGNTVNDKEQIYKSEVCA